MIKVSKTAQVADSMGGLRSNPLIIQVEAETIKQAEDMIDNEIKRYELETRIEELSSQSDFNSEQIKKIESELTELLAKR